MMKNRNYILAFLSFMVAGNYTMAQNTNCGVTVNAGPDITICNGKGMNLNGSSNAYEFYWYPPEGLSDTKILNPFASPSTTTTYYIVGVALGNYVTSNLFDNSEFETGSIAPASSDYTPYTNYTNWLSSTGGYMVLSSTQIKTLFGCTPSPQFGAFTMVITPTDPSVNIWCETVIVKPNTPYWINYRVMGMKSYPGSLPKIGMTVNGTLMYTNDATPCEHGIGWIWNSGDLTSAEFCFQNYGGTGPDHICGLDFVRIMELCAAKDSVLVTVDDIDAEVFPPDEINCLNSPITIEATSTFSGPNVSYSWTTTNGHMVSGDKTLKLVVDAPGSYTFHIKKLKGCEKDITVIVKGSVTKPDILIKSYDIDCKHETGSIEALSKSKSPIFEWTGPYGFSSMEASNTFLQDSGTYTVKVTDYYGCVSTQSIQINNKRTLIEAEISGEPILSCAKDSVILEVHSLAKNPVYHWTGPLSFKKDTVDKITVKNPGWYKLTTSNADGCKEYDSIYVTSFLNPIQIIIHADTISCKKQEVVLKLETDTTATFLWTGPNGYKSNQYQPTVSDPGWYQVKIFTKDSCTHIDSIFVAKDNIPDIFISANDTITCDKPIIQISGGSNTPGTILEWITPVGLIKNQNFIQAIDSGKYILNVTDVNGCKVSRSLQLFKDVTPPVVIGYNDTLSCNQDTLNLISNVNNARAYSWSGPNNFSSNNSSPRIFEIGAYILTITAMNGCQSTAIINIEEDKLIPNLQIQADTINCIKTSIIPTVISDNSAIEFNWTGPNGFNSIIKAPTIFSGGLFTLKVKGKNGCENTQTIQIIEDTKKPTASIEADTIQCKTTANIRALNISPGVNIQWQGPKGFLSNLPNATISDSGFYVLTLTAKNGCIYQDSIFVFQKDKLPDVFAIDDTLTCALPKLFLNGGSLTPGVTFEWTGPNGFTSNLAKPEIQDSGLFTLKVTDPNGCEASKQIHISKNSEAAIISIQKSPKWLTCKDTLITVKLTANQIAKNISWKGPGGFQSNQDQISIKVSGQYIYVFTNEFGCISKDSFLIQEIKSFPIFMFSNDSINCIRNQVTLQLTSDNFHLLYLWSGPNNFSSTLMNPTIQFGGFYNVQVTDTTNGCQLRQTVIVKSDTTKPDLSLSADTLTCIHPSAPVKAGSSLQGFTMKWTGPNGFTYTLPQFATKIPGRYFCTITNPKSGCSTTSFIDVLEDTSRIKEVITQLTNASCNKDNGKINIQQVNGGSPPYRFSIDNGATFINNVSALDLAPGNYTVLVEDTNGCQFNVSLKIDEDRSVNISLVDLIQLKAGEKSQLHLDILTDTAFVASVLWTPSDQLSCNNCIDPILTVDHDELILVTVIDKNGCVDTASIQVQILKKEANIYFPNTFSPNGDNINDYFYPIGLNQGVKVNSLNIYDRWGNLLFQNKNFPPGNELDGWNGRSIDQKNVNPGVYVYWAEIELIDGKVLIVKGDVTLVR